MIQQPPEWPDQPDQPTQPPGVSPPSRSTLLLASAAVVSGVLIVALLGILVLVLSNGAYGATAGNQTQTGQTQNGQAATASSDSGTGDGSGTPASSGAASGGGGGTGGGKTHPTPTPSGGTTMPTPTAGIVVVGGGLTFGSSPSVHQVGNQVTLSGSSVGPAVATCPSGELALSGGWSIPPHAGALVYSSARSSTRSWAVYVRHGSSVDVTAYAECLANTSGATIVERTAYTSVAAGDFGYTEANCNTGEVIVGGGFYSQTGLVVYGSGFKSSTNGGGYAGAYAKNFGSTSVQFGIYAECLTYANARSSQTAYGETGTEITPGNGGRAASPPCQSGTYVSGGGFVGPAGVFYDTSAEGSGSSTTWAIYDYNNTSGDHSYLQSWAVCLGFS